jgi:hypothetical protein
MIPSERLSRVLELYHYFCRGIVISFATVKMLFWSRLLSAFSAVAVATSNTNTNPSLGHEERVSQFLSFYSVSINLIRAYKGRVE